MTWRSTLHQRREECYAPYVKPPEATTRATRTP
jgi:hypothetical protein